MWWLWVLLGWLWVLLDALLGGDDPIASLIFGARALVDEHEKREKGRPHGGDKNGGERSSR